MGCGGTTGWSKQTGAGLVLLLFRVRLPRCCSLLGRRTSLPRGRRLRGSRASLLSCYRLLGSSSPLLCPCRFLRWGQFLWHGYEDTSRRSLVSTHESVYSPATLYGMAQRI